MSESVLAFFTLHGIPALVLVVLGAALALPLPASVLLITAGVLSAETGGSILPLLAAGVAAAILGDHSAYFVGRFASPFVERKLGPRRLRPARAVMHRHGTAGVFLSRCVVPPLGPTVSYAAGITHLPLPKFVLADVAGATLWVTGYVTLGRTFSSDVRAIFVLVQDTLWVAVAGAVVLAFLARGRRRRVRARRVLATAAEEAAPALGERLSV